MAVSFGNYGNGQRTARVRNIVIHLIIKLLPPALPPILCRCSLKVLI